MRIAQVCDYIAPAANQMGAERIVERLTKGLVAAGHDVTMVLNAASKKSPVEGAKLASVIDGEYDLLHFHGWEPETYNSYHLPWVTTIHGYELHQQQELGRDNPHVVAVSAFAQERIGATQYVWNCADEDEFKERIKKDSYLLWLAGTDWGEQKGLFTTIGLAKRLRCPLKIAGTGINQDIIHAIKSQCSAGIEYLGAVNGAEKVRLLQRAQALVLLTQLPDACPVTVSEALMCGTPVIASDQGSMPEIVKSGVTGFICKTQTESVQAIASLKRIDPVACRDYAVKHFSIATCVKSYAKIYKSEIERFRQQH